VAWHNLGISGKGRVIKAPCLFFLAPQHIVQDSYVPKVATAAMIGKNLKPEKPLIIKTSLE